MKITAIRPATGEGGVIATFDLEIDAELKLLGLILKRTRTGVRVFPPQNRDRISTAAIAPSFAARIIELATSEIGGARLERT